MHAHSSQEQGMDQEYGSQTSDGHTVNICYTVPYYIKQDLSVYLFLRMYMCMDTQRHVNMLTHLLQVKASGGHNIASAQETRHLAAH